MSNLENNIKIESIFAYTEVRKYIAEVIDKNIEKYNLPLGEFEWSLAFLETYKRFKIGNDKTISKGQNHSTEICNYIIHNFTQKTNLFLKELFILIAILEREKIIESSEEFTGEMFAFMFDPARSYLAKDARDKIIEDIQYIFRRYGRDIMLDPATRRYVFKKTPTPQPIDKDAICLYNSSIYIQNKIFNYKNADSTITTIKISPVSIRILEYLIGKGRGNKDNWSTKKDIADSLKIAEGTVGGSLSFFRTKVFNNIKINLFEEKGEDKDGKQYRINPKVLP